MRKIMLEFIGGVDTGDICFNCEKQDMTRGIFDRIKEELEIMQNKYNNCPLENTLVDSINISAIIDIKKIIERIEKEMR